MLGVVRVTFRKRLTIRGTRTFKLPVMFPVSLKLLPPRREELLIKG